MPHRSKLAVLAGVAVLALVPSSALAGPPKGTPKTDCKKQKKCPEVRQGRMTGHGQVFNYRGNDKVQWEFRNSVCQSNRFPDLKVEFGGHKFVLTSYSSAGLICFDRPGISEGNPVAGFDSIRAQGTGTLDGVAGASITFRFTDAGEPGVNDTADFTIMRGSTVVLDVDDVKIQDGGNHQAHRK